MQNKTVKELKFLAKEMGLKGYSGLRKAGLIQKIEDHRRNSSSNILDEAGLELSVPILEPVQFTAKKKYSNFEEFGWQHFGLNF